MNWFLNNREVIRNLAINTSTTTTPTYTQFCTTSEVELDSELEEKDFYVFCDAIKRSIITGAKLTLKGTIKIDMNNAAVVSMLGDIHAILKSGTVSQFNNVQVQFDLIEKVTTNVLTYVTYDVPVSLKLTSIGGAAEGEGELAFEMTIIGKGTVVTGA